MNIKIYLAELRGYCAGVNRAIQILNEAIKKFGVPIYVNHEIIHNKFIINFYEKKGVIFGENLEKIPENSIMIMSAHGIGPEFIKKVKKKNIKYIDASCPLVTKVHLKAKKYISEGYEIIYIGKKGHQEAEALKEENPEKIHIIGNEKDLRTHPQPLPCKEGSKKYALLTQTTMSIFETKELIKKIKLKFPNIVLEKKEDICYATTNRQEAVKKISKNNLDLLIIVGSKNSSNSNKLKNIGEKMGIKSILIDSSAEIDITMLENIFKNKNSLSAEGFSPLYLNIGISSGASAPEHLVKEVLDFFRKVGNTQIDIIKTVEEKIVFPFDLKLK